MHIRKPGGAPRFPAPSFSPDHEQARRSVARDPAPRRGLGGFRRGQSHRIAAGHPAPAPGPASAAQSPHRRARRRPGHPSRLVFRPGARSDAGPSLTQQGTSQSFPERGGAAATIHPATLPALRTNARRHQVPQASISRLCGRPSRICRSRTLHRGTCRPAHALRDRGLPRAAARTRFDRITVRHPRCRSRWIPCRIRLDFRRRGASGRRSRIHHPESEPWTRTPPPCMHRRMQQRCAT